jgi:hypothetical protein
MNLARMGTAGGTIFAVGGVVLLLRLHKGGVHGGWLAVIGVGYVALIGLLLLLAMRSSTTVTDDGVVVRHTWSTSVYPWAQIADIRYERVTGAASRITIHGAVLYDARLRRVVLPFLNDRSVDAAVRATTELRDRWTAARGADWQPRTADVDQQVAARRGRAQVWLHALLAMLGGLLLAIVIVLVALLTASREFMDTDLFGELPLLILILPAVAFFGTAAVGLLRRR